jgi:hypothetical protein
MRYVVSRRKLPMRGTFLRNDCDEVDASASADADAGWLLY